MLLLLVYYSFITFFKETDNQLAVQKPVLTETPPAPMVDSVEQTKQANQANAINSKPADKSKSEARLNDEPKVTSVKPGLATENNFSLKDLDNPTVTEQIVTAESQKNSEGLLSLRKKEIKLDSLTTPSNLQIVKGKVLLSEDGTPVPGVNIIIKGTNQGTVTDMNGDYKIEVPANSKLVYSFIGLQTQEVSTLDKSDITINLQPDVSQLGEVVVTGYSPYPKEEGHEPVIKLATPAGGIRAYDKYLKNSLRYPQEALDNKVKGRVTLTFTVNTDGSLDDFNVLKGLGFGCDEEVIRLVKSGPKWSPTTEDNVAVESEVRVRVKFSLPD
jgi:TonB family protein